ncbi:cytochrome c peroxidase [Pseudogemmobacter bohemicus]|uniref:cytochrome c peroxidase n=1 Tax=Pseudogemmobacter bohemicus TaxID=2250708 RepID=UPI001E523961|nr:cytochrome c peroxidase [Pseudogemmobacter bohemicus]
MRATAATLALAACLSAFSASADVVKEVPWHPATASYRTGLFLADLVPPQWDRIRESYAAPLPSASIARPGQGYFDALPDGIGAAVLAAIEAEDAQALYEASTRGLSVMTRQALAEAEAGLADPGLAQRKIREAQAYYRGFESFVMEVDPEGGRRVGAAWLDIVGAAGSAGIMGVGAIAGNAQDFAEARATIETYLLANFEPADFTERDGLTPLPETIVAAKGEVQVAPWLPPGSDLMDQDPFPMLVLNFEERGIDETDLPLVAYGDMLFDSPNIFGEPAKSLGITCSTCHNRSDINQRFFIPGISHQPGAADVRGSFFNPGFNDWRGDSLDIPSLRGTRFTAPYGRDGRFASLNEFNRNVIVNEFGGPEPTPYQLDALLAYMLEFDFLPNARIDNLGRLTAGASEAELRGEALFRKPFPQMDGMACSSCHVPSSNFLDRKAYDIGSKTGSYEGARDGAFDTPTLLGTVYTAPYFHDGSLPTLASVVDWFDTRYKLELGENERADLTAYLEAIGAADEPYQTFEGRNSAFRLAWEELTTFASTYDTLAKSRDAENAILMLETVAGDLALDSTAMVNSAARTRVLEMAGLLDGMRAAVGRDDWDGAGEIWASFKDLQERHDEDMY